MHMNSRGTIFPIIDLILAISLIMLGMVVIFTIKPLLIENKLIKQVNKELILAYNVMANVIDDRKFLECITRYIMYNDVQALTGAYSMLRDRLPNRPLKMILLASNGQILGEVGYVYMPFVQIRYAFMIYEGGVWHKYVLLIRISSEK